jgi:hypothetical protein
LGLGKNFDKIILYDLALVKSHIKCFYEEKKDLWNLLKYQEQKN